MASVAYVEAISEMANVLVISAAKRSLARFTGDICSYLVFGEITPKCGPGPTFTSVVSPTAIYLRRTRYILRLTLDTRHNSSPLASLAPSRPGKRDRERRSFEVVSTTAHDAF